MVSGHVPGDLPTDPRTPDLETVVLRREVSTGTAALDRQVQRILEDEVGSSVNDDELMVALYRTFLAARGQAEGDAPGRSPHQIILHVCPRCQAGQQVAAGVTFDVHPALVERALCDAQHLGHVDGAAPARAAQEPSPAVRRMVLARDHHRSRVPWCRAARNIEVHHIDGRRAEGCHTPPKLITLCTFHHTQHHNGELVIRGATEAEAVFESVHAHTGAMLRHSGSARARRR
jgi:hypothetical protein